MSRTNAAARGAMVVAAVLCLACAFGASAQQPAPQPPQPPGSDCTLVQIRTKFDQKLVPQMVGCEVKTTAQNLLRVNQKADIRATPGPPPVGTILEQSPPPRTPWASGGVFELSYSDGKPVAQVGNVSVSMTLEPRGPYRPGETVKYWIVIGNPGSSSPSVRVDAATANLDSVIVTGACTAFPCQTIPLSPDSNTSIFVAARIASAGAFANEVRISSTLADQNPDDNVKRIDEFASAPEPPPRDAPTRVPPRADIGVAVEETYSEGDREGDTVNYAIVVTNRGPAPATQVSLDVSWDNVSLSEIGGACDSLPCKIGTIAPNDSVEIRIGTTLGGPGKFSGQVTAQGQPQTDPDISDNVRVFSGVVVARFALGLWAALAAVGVIALGAGTHMLRRAHWLRLIEVVPSLEREVTASNDRLAVAAPTLELKAWLEAGTAQPTSPIPFTRRRV